MSSIHSNPTYRVACKALSTFVEFRHSMLSRITYLLIAVTAVNNLASAQTPARTMRSNVPEAVSYLPGDWHCVSAFASGKRTAGNVTFHEVLSGAWLEQNRRLPGVWAIRYRVRDSSTPPHPAHHRLCATNRAQSLPTLLAPPTSVMQMA